MKQNNQFLRSGFDRPLNFLEKRTCHNCNHYDDGYCYYNDVMVSPNHGCAFFS